jgi:ubiquinone/menaquinone biosynthesis C-methylase UbiE
MKRGILILWLLTGGCDAIPSASDANVDSDVTSASFPTASRPVAPIVASRWSTEVARDKVKESEVVMDAAGVNPGMTVADIGAGEGYYTIRLAARVGPTGRVLAQDIIPEVRDKLAGRVTHDNLDNVSVKLGEEADPKLPANSFDRVFLIHMYHEVGKPYEFLWRLRPSLRVGGRLIVVDANRSTGEHGTPPKLLDCEMRATGYRQVEFHELPQAGGYLAAFEVSGRRPEPHKIRVCKQ